MGGSRWGEGAVADGGGPEGPAELLALLEAQRTQASAAMEPDPRVIYGAWGLAWLVGFAAMYLAQVPSAPLDLGVGPAFVVFFACLAAAMVVTGVHLARRFAGVRGVSSRIGAMLGWSWFLGFAALNLIMAGAARAGAPPPVMDLLWAAVSGLVVGLLYLVTGALWQDRVQYGLGVWIVVVSGAGALAGAPEVHLVMSLAGGGGFLLAAAFFALRAGAAPGRDAS